MEAALLVWFSTPSFLVSARVDYLPGLLMICAGGELFFALTNLFFKNMTGPVLVSPSVITDPQTLRIRGSHNGSVVQDGHTKDMIFSIAKQISYLSQGTTLEAGTIFLTGTPAGIGYFRNPRLVLKDGDEFSVEIEGIGSLVNKVRYE